LRPTNIRTHSEPVRPQVVDESVGILEEIIRSSLREIKDIDTYRAKAGNDHLTQRACVALNMESGFRVSK